MVSALTVAGMLKVVTVGPEAVKVVVNWVWKVVLNEGMSPLLSVDVQGFVALPSSFGGPLVISGHGGSAKVREVLPPFPFDSVTTTFGTGTLGVAIKPPLVSPDVTLTLENGIPPITMSEIVKVSVVMVVKKTVTTCPFPRVDVPVFPY